MSKTFKGPPPVEPPVIAAKKPAPAADTGQRDRVALHCYSALISCGMSHDPAAQHGRDGTWAQVYAKRAFGFADAFLAERDARNGADEVI